MRLVIAATIDASAHQSKQDDPRQKMNEPPPSKTIHVKELNLDIIPPCTARANEPEYGGSKIVVVGKPGTGKSTLIASLLYVKKHIIPCGMVMSGSEDSNGFYSKIFPKSFVFHNYDEEQLKQFVKRQKIAKRHLPNPWAVVLCDDCTDSNKIFNSKIQQGLFKRGRHWKMLYILSLQYAMDVKPSIRTNVDGVFILREPILKNRKSLFENYASVIGDFNIFCQLMDQLTNDYCSLYIHQAAHTNDWRDCVFYYKADLVPKNFKFGCKDYWKFHHKRFNPRFVRDMEF